MLGQLLGFSKRLNPIDTYSWAALGFCALISQVVYLRECINLFAGNELSIGLVLFIWLLFGGFGSFIMGKLSNRIGHRSSARLRSPFLIAFALILPGTLIALRFSRLFLGLEAGEISNLADTIAATVVCLAPLSFIQGGLFAIYCGSREEDGTSGREGSAIGSQPPSESRVSRASAVYSLEAAGAVLSGIIMHYLLACCLMSFAILLLLSGLTILGAALLAIRRRSAISIGACILLIACLFITAFQSRKIENWSVGLAFGKDELVEVRETRYGRLALTRAGEQSSLFENGLLLFSYPDRLSAEEAVHIPLLAHSSPSKVLLLGGGCGGAIGEILKHHPENIDYVELNDEIISISKKMLPPDEFGALEDASVRIHYGDGRRFVENTHYLYDVIILNMPRPTDARLNRFFTVEFFSKARNALARGGILALQVPSSDSYLSLEQREFICSIANTLKAVFQTVVLTPGETGHLLASDSDSIPLVPEILTARLLERKIETDFITDWSIPYRFEPFRMAAVKDVIDGCSDSGVSLNKDFSPVCYQFAILLWGSEFGGGVARVYGWLAHRTWIEVYAALAAILLLLFAQTCISKKPKRVAIIVSLASIGFLEISVEMIMIVAFQIFFGNIYSMLGLLVCSYMGGIAVGAGLARRRLVIHPPGEVEGKLVILQFMAAIYPILLIAFLSLSRTLGAATALQIVFIGAIFASGVIGGALYIYGNAAYSVVHGEQKQTAGTTYFADLAGSSIGAIATTSFLLPLLGVIQALLVAAISALIGLVLLLISLHRRTS
ncbi:MAG: hypothetical protein JW941_00040 [Candidatus Coatesbacteria bacterium]|nr:hypothetical protein [Candidatus Coatesbacteria bacterium]